MKRRAAGSSRSKHSRFSWEDASFSSSPTSQLELMTYLGLANPKPKPMEPKLRECFVLIETSKCQICKRLFKCKTDTMKHIEKKHEYLLRKTDQKLVRVVMKLGKEKFHDSKIDSKYFVAPDAEFATLKKSEKIKSKKIKSAKSEELDQKPLEVSPTAVHKKLPMNISNDFIGKGSVSLSNALFDMKSLAENASYKNGRICKGEGSAFSTFAERVDLEQEESRLIPSAFGSCDGGSSPATSLSDSETILYVSDIEVDLGEDYEVIHTNVTRLKEEDDIDDGEIVIVKEVLRNDFDSIRRRLELAGVGEVDSDLGVIMQANGQVKLEPKVEPMEAEPIAQVPLYPDIMDLDEDGISDAETEILGGELGETGDVDDDIADLLATLEDDDTQNTLDLEAEKVRGLFQKNSELPADKSSDLAQNNYVLPAEETYNFTVEEQRQAPTVQEEEIITIDDDEPVVVEERLVPQSDLTSKLKDWLLAYAKETVLAKRKNVSDVNNNKGAAASGADLPEEVAAKMSILVNAPQYQRACERALKELGIKMEDWH